MIGGWMMKVTKVKSLYQLSFLPRTFPVNCYVMEEEKELFLFDAALPYSHRGIVSFAKKIGKPITKIFLTHAHEDHVGALDQVKRAFPEAKVYCSHLDALWLNGDVTRINEVIDTPIRGGVPKNIKTIPDHTLQEGDEIGSLLTIETPGHTPGSLSFFDQRTNALIVGDAFQTRGGIAVAGKVKPLFPFPAWATWDRQEAVKSAEKLLTYEASILAVGHGKMLEQPLGKMEQSIKEALRT